MLIKILLRKIHCEALIGARSVERLKPQPLVIDLEYEYEVKKALIEDKIEQAIDYSKLKSKLVDYVEKTKFVLLESLCIHASNFLFEHFDIVSLKLRIYKPLALQSSAEVSAEYFRRID